MTERITAKRGGPVPRVLEDLLAPGTERLDSPESRVQVFYVEIEVHGSPMALELPPVAGIG